MLYHNSKKEIELKIHLLSDIEEFREFFNYDFDDDLYLFFGCLGRYVQFSIDTNKHAVTSHTFEIINNLLEEKAGIEFENMIVVQIIEMLYDKKEYLDAGYMHLNEKGKALLLSIKENFGPFN